MKNIRNEFTDALNEEIAARKILNKTKNHGVEEDIFLSEVVEEVAEPEIKKSDPIKISAEKNIPPVEKISVEKKSEPRKIVITKADFEKRVLAEADNDFYDDIKSRVAEKKNLPPVFHSKGFENISSEPEDNNIAEPKIDLNIKLSRVERIGVILSVVMLVYSIATFDKALCFMAISVISSLTRPLVGRLFGQHNNAVQNAMRSFSIVTFFGAIFFIFQS